MAADTPENSGEHSQSEIDAALAAAGDGEVAQGGESAASSPDTPDSMQTPQTQSAPSKADTASASNASTSVIHGMNSPIEPDSQEGASDESIESIESTDADISADEMEGSAAAAAVPLNLPEFSDSNKGVGPNGIGLLGDVKLDVKIELGRADMYIEDVLKLGAGAVVELDKLAGDPVDVLVNDRLVARGEVLVLNDNFCVRISEILPGADEALQAAS